MTDNLFENRKSIEQVEESTELAPKFGDDGLIPVVTTDFKSGELLMQGYMNNVAFAQTIRLGEAVYYSRSRKSLWHKGNKSGFKQIIKEIMQTLIRKNNLKFKICKYIKIKHLKIITWRKNRNLNLLLKHNN